MKIKEKVLTVINKTEEVLFPHYVCPFCATETPDGMVCSDCDTHKINPKYCEKCGAHVSADSKVCIQCKDYERIFDKNFSLYEYDGSVSAAIQKFKFKEAKYLAIDFAKLLAQKFVDCKISVDIVTCVPTSKKKIKQRGYNQSAEMANEFCKLTNNLFVDLLIKTKETVEQKELSRKERLENLLDSIAVADKWQVKGKNILIIDDVFTTGSTISACARALKKAGAYKVYGLTLAKTSIKL